MLFTAVFLGFVALVLGAAIDIAHVSAARRELQRSVDAAALAGAGKLGFDSTVFPTVRLWAGDYARANAYHAADGGLVLLDANAGNAAGGDIVVGSWNNGAFTSWDAATDALGTRVNAVRCRTRIDVPTSFLRVLGLSSLTVSAMATAIANPPNSIGCDEAVLPLAVTPCSFRDAGTGAFSTSAGCGTGITFIRSQTLCDNSPGTAQICNTATWASLDGSTPNTPYLRDAIQAAANPGSQCTGRLRTNDLTESNNGMLDSVYSTLVETFRARRQAVLAEDICPAGGCTGVPIYPRTSGGWEVVVMLIDTPCPPAALSGSYRLLTYARFVVTQLFAQQEGCVVLPNPDPQAQAYCENADGSPRRDNDLRAIFGYFRCGQLGEMATLDAVPRAALAPRLRLVQ